MRAWQCTECAYVDEGERPPHRCPECGVSGDRFELIEEQTDDWYDEPEWYEDEDLAELE